MSERMLQSLGYEITACNDPIVALDLFRKNPDTFDCVISDMSMPGMTGEKLLTEVLRIRKDIPTILCTGYSETFSARHALQLGIREYLLKPVKREKMAAAVRRVLDNFSTT